MTLGWLTSTPKSKVSLSHLNVAVFFCRALTCIVFIHVTFEYSTLASGDKNHIKSYHPPSDRSQNSYQEQTPELETLEKLETSEHEEVAFGDDD